jgi:pyrrolidone-carboxylate peptidase
VNKVWLLLLLLGCASEGETAEDDVRLDTTSKLARAQYDANVEFANRYRSTCAATSGPRVLVTGFGRFMSIEDNATGRIVSALVPSARYPATKAPKVGEIDPPAPQLSVGTGSLTLPQSGNVNVCAMILPVYWDLAPILIAKEIESFKPDVVIMNGVAGGVQPMWFEMGALNEAQPSDDGSDILRPAPKPGQVNAKLVDEDALGSRALYAPWKEMQAAATEAIRKNADVDEQGVAFSDVLTGARLAGFPRRSNTYLCNNVTYVTNYLLDNPGRSVSLMRATVARAGRPNSVSVRLLGDYSRTVREFIHWPSSLEGKHVDAASQVLRSVVDAAIAGNKAGQSKRGDNGIAATDLNGGDTF